MEAGATSIVLCASVYITFGVWERLVFADEVDDVEAEAIAAPFEPEPHDVVNSMPDIEVLPVEIRLLFAKQVQVVLVGGFVILPGTPCLPSHS